MTTSIPEDQVVYKLCKKCGKEYPATPENFPLMDGRYLKSPCRPCRREHDRKRKADPEKKASNRITAKKYHQEHREEILQRKRQYDARRRDHRLAYNALHREEIRAYSRSYGPKYREEHREEIRRKGRLYDAGRVELRRQLYELHREEKRAYSRWYNLTHKEERRLYEQLHKEDGRIRSHRRRASKRGSVHHHTKEQIREQYARQKSKCYYCSKKVKWGEHHIEHVTPLSRGGSNDISNIVIACPPCNLSKSNRMPYEWPEGNRLI